MTGIHALMGMGDRRGYTVLSLVFILLALVGSYKFYNNNVVSSDTEILASSMREFGQGDGFAYTVINRFVNMIKEGKDAMCQDGTTKASSVQKLKSAFTLAKTFHGESINNEAQKKELLDLSYQHSDADPPPVPEAAITCLASTEELRNIFNFELKSEIAFSSRRCSHAVKVEIAGKTRKSIQSKKTVEGKTFDHSTRITIAPARWDSFSMIFRNKDSREIKLAEEARIEFHSSVFISEEDDGDDVEVDKMMEDLERVQFNQAVLTDALAVSLGDDHTSLNDFMGAFRQGILTKALRGISQMIDDTDGFKEGDCGSKTRAVVFDKPPNAHNDKEVKLKKSSPEGLAVGCFDELRVELPSQDPDPDNPVQYELYANVALNVLVVTGKGDLRVHNLIKSQKEDEVPSDTKYWPGAWKQPIKPPQSLPGCSPPLSSPVAYDSEAIYHYH